MMYNLRGITKDVIHMSDITDLAFSPSTSTTKELSFKFDNGKSTVVLTSPKIDLIMKVA